VTEPCLTPRCARPCSRQPSWRALSTQEWHSPRPNGKEVSQAITDAMGPDFLTDLITDALQDNIPGLLGSGIPFFGAPVSATLAAALAFQLTWRAGIGTVVFIRSGWAWPDGDRRKTMRTIQKQLVPRRASSVDANVLARLPEMFSSIPRE